MLSNTTKKHSKSSRVLRQIAVSQENYEALQKLGKVPESFNDVITRLIDYYNNLRLAGKI